MGSLGQVVTAAADDALGRDDMCALVERLARREVSPGELRTAALARAQAVEPTLNAVIAWVHPASDGDDGDSAPLAGIPVAVKDNEDLAGYPTLQGSRAVSDRPAPQSSPFVRQLVGLGLAPIVKTAMPEFGLTASTESTRHGATRNPWNTGRSTGGSSGGSAALVAAGVLPLAHANDGGGSTRIPAACCGLVGLKPTRGRLVDRPEVDRLPVPITAQGVLTRSVRDTARFYAEAERLHRNPRLPPVGDVTAPSMRRLRVGVVLTGGLGLPVSADTTTAIRDVAVVCESLGHRVAEIPVPVGPRFAADFLDYWSFLAFVLHRAGGLALGVGFDRSRTEDFTQGLSSRLVRRSAHLPGALRRLRAFARSHERVFDAVDVVLSPVVGHEAPPIGYLGPGVDFDTHLRRLLPFTSFTPLQNVSGSPGISLPLGRSESGLPVGVHVAAAFGQERVLLELGYELEEALPWRQLPTAA